MRHPQGLDPRCQRDLLADLVGLAFLVARVARREVPADAFLFGLLALAPAQHIRNQRGNSQGAEVGVLTGGVPRCHVGDLVPEDVREFSLGVGEHEQPAGNVDSAAR